MLCNDNANCCDQKTKHFTQTVHSKQNIRNWSTTIIVIMNASGIMSQLTRKLGCFRSVNIHMKVLRMVKMKKTLTLQSSNVYHIA